MNFFSKDNQSALQALEYAQQIAFAPIVFQASKSLRDLGFLSVIEKAGNEGARFQELTAKTGVSEYGATVLLEAGLGIGLLTFSEEKYRLTKAGSFILNDKMTIVNMDFVQDVCYKGMFELKESIETGKPEGLKHFGSHKTVYEALSTLPEQAQKSWFAFDHFYSDDSFSSVLPHVFQKKPKSILDIGGNTGKWALKCLNYNDSVNMGIADLPGQLKMAEKNIREAGFASRTKYHEVNMLDADPKLPKEYDVIWMSQFLDCFSEEEIVQILKNCHEALDGDGSVFILEPFWDMQKFKISAFCLQMTSLYFTNIANGNSRMYSAEGFRKLIEKAGFVIEEQIDQVGISHTLLKCKKQ